MPSPSTIVSLGYGSWGSISDIVAMGYGLGAAVAPAFTPTPSSGTFELSYGGVPFRRPHKSIVAEIERLYPFGDLDDFAYPDGLGVSPSSPTGGLPPNPTPPELRLNELYWPSDARRWAIFRGLMHADDLARFNFAVIKYHTLAIDDGTVGRISTLMYYLPPRPIFGVEGASDLYLVTLVDLRYFWRQLFYGRSRLSSPKTPTTWADVFTVAGADFLPTATTITTGTISADYLAPSNDSPFTVAGSTSGLPLPFVLDMAAANVGKVFVRKRNGTLQLVDYATATANAESAYAAASGNLVAGGRIFAGSTSDPGYVRQNVLPNRVVTWFPNWSRSNDTVNVGSYFGAQVGTSAAMGGWPGGLGNLILTPAALGAPYSTWTVDGGDLDLFTMAKAQFAGYLDPSLTPPDATSALNAATLTTLATRLAKDVYDWSAIHLDAVFRGVVDFNDEAGVDTLVRWSDEGITTRVTRRPYTSGPQWFWHGNDTFETEKWKNAVYAQYGTTGAKIVDLAGVDNYHALASNTGGGGFVVPQNNFNNPVAAVDPGATDDKSKGWAVGSEWLNASTKIVWVCVDASTGAAVWKKSSITIPVPVTDGGTGLASYTAGGILYASASTTLGQPTDVRITSNKLQVKAASNRWIGFNVASV